MVKLGDLRPNMVCSQAALQFLDSWSSTRGLLSQVVDERALGGGVLEFYSIDELKSGDHVGQELGATIFVALHLRFQTAVPTDRGANESESTDLVLQRKGQSLAMASICRQGWIETGSRAYRQSQGS